MEKPIRICLVINAFAVGGAEAVVLNLARGLNEKQFDVTVLAVMESSAKTSSVMLKRFQMAGIKTRSMSIRSFRNPISLLRLWWFFRVNRFQVIHGHNRPSDGWAAILARLAGAPGRMWTRHLVYRDMTEKQLNRYRQESRSAHRIFAVSESVRRNCIEYEGIEPEKVLTVHNGIDMGQFSPLSPEEVAEIRRSLGVQEGEKFLLFVGRIDHQKAPDAFVRLIWRLRELGLPARGFMCGKGPLDVEIEGMIRNGAPGVEKLGIRNDIPRLLAAADLFVSTSRNEGLPLNVMEAMAAGAPVVAPEIGQISCLMEGHRVLGDGLVSPPPLEGAVTEEQINRWAAKVAEILDNEDVLEEMGIRGRETISAGFSLDKMVGEYTRAYLDAVGVDGIPE